MGATRRLRRLGWVTSFLARSVAVATASLGLALLLWALVPAFFGFRSNLVTSDSMRPNVSRGDIVLTRRVAPERIRPGHVVLVDDPSRERALLHRVRSVDDGRFTTQGDANPSPDFPPWEPSQIRGVGHILVPRVGMPMLWAMSHVGFITAVLVQVAIALAYRRSRYQPRSNVSVCPPSPFAPTLPLALSAAGAIRTVVLTETDGRAQAIARRLKIAERDHRIVDLDMQPSDATHGRRGVRFAFQWADR